jgi:hypothetical protein
MAKKDNPRIKMRNSMKRCGKKERVKKKQPALPIPPIQVKRVAKPENMKNGQRMIF